MFQFDREYLLKREKQQDKSCLLPETKHLGKKQHEIINHLVTELYHYMSHHNLSVEVKAASLNICISVVVECLSNKINSQGAKSQLQKKVSAACSRVPGNLSPVMSHQERQLLLKFFNSSFFPLYTFYQIAFTDYVDYNVQLVDPWYVHQVKENGIVQGKVNGDPAKLTQLQGLVSEKKEVVDSKNPPKKK